MFQQKDKYIVIIFSFLLTIGCTLVHALSGDQKQIMHLISDSVDLSQKKHRGIYKGNVELIQGTTHLRAAKAITKGDVNNKLVLAIAYGDKTEQAHYWTQTNPNEPLFHAYADRIKYYPQKHLIELIGNARIEQGTNSLIGNHMTYDSLHQHLISKGVDHHRTTIIFHPHKNAELMQ